MNGAPLNCHPTDLMDLMVQKSWRKNDPCIYSKMCLWCGVSNILTKAWMFLAHCTSHCCLLFLFSLSLCFCLSFSSRVLCSIMVVADLSVKHDLVISSSIHFPKNISSSIHFPKKSTDNPCLWNPGRPGVRTYVWTPRNCIWMRTCPKQVFLLEPCLSRCAVSSQICGRH